MLYDILYLFLIFLCIYTANKFKSNQFTKLALLFFFLGILFLILFFENLIFNTTLLFVFFIIYFIIIYFLGKKNYKEIITTNLSFSDSRINDNLNILFIADLQFDKTKKFFNLEAFDRLIDKINSIEYDILLLGGDYLNYPSHIDTLIDGLKNITNKENIYCVMGNHDFYFKEELIEKLKKINIHTLENSVKQLKIKNTMLNISGVKDVWMDNTDYSPIKDTLDSNFYHIHLLHNPDYITNLKDENIDLVLSGHYHHGQVNLLPFISAARIITKYDFGLYHLNKIKLYVTSGVGGTFMKGVFGQYIRWNSKSEVTLIQLKNKH